MIPLSTKNFCQKGKENGETGNLMSLLDTRVQGAQKPSACKRLICVG
jgi:hypothetical protein